jgi:hypothetical protein
MLLRRFLLLFFLLRAVLQKEGGIMKTLYDVMNTTLVSLVLVAIGYLTLERGWLAGPVIFLLGTVPLISAALNRLEIRRLIPDIVFGAMDTGLLMIAALTGAHAFGVLGAIVGSAIGDAVTDGIAGFFEGGIAERLRAIGIEESRTQLGSALGKMSGCLLGSGLVLTAARLLGVQS